MDASRSGEPSPRKRSARFPGSARKASWPWSLGRCAVAGVPAGLGPARRARPHVLGRIELIALDPDERDARRPGRRLVAPQVEEVHRARQRPVRVRVDARRRRSRPDARDSRRRRSGRRACATDRRRCGRDGSRSAARRALRSCTSASRSRARAADRLPAVRRTIRRANAGSSRIASRAIAVLRDRLRAQMVERADHDRVVDRLAVLARPLQRLQTAERSADRDPHALNPERTQRAALRLDDVGDVTTGKRGPHVDRRVRATTGRSNRSSRPAR